MNGRYRMDFRKQINKKRNEIIASTQELIQIKSLKEPGVEGMPFGKGMNHALNYVLDKAEKMGFKVKNLDGYCGYAEYGEGEYYIGIFSHVDTCKEGDGWTVPPFEGKIMNNRIYGRGSLDNKGPLIAALYGMKAVMDLDKPPKIKIRLIIGTDEERYYEDMKHYLSKEKPPIAGFTLDGQFPVVFAEKGLSMMEYRGLFTQEKGERISFIEGGVSENTVPEYCKALLLTGRKSEIISKLILFAKENRHNMTARAVKEGVEIESFGLATHSMAVEMGINAICPLLVFLKQLEFGGECVQGMIQYIDDVLGDDIYGHRLDVAFSDEFSGNLTINFGIFSYQNDEAKARFDIRYPVTCDFRHVSKKITESFEKNGFTLQENSYWDPVYFPKEHFLIEALLKAYREVTKDYSDPISSGSGSYSKVILNVAAFGAIFPGESQAWHQANEYVDIDNLIKMSEIYATAIYELANTL